MADSIEGGDGLDLGSDGLVVAEWACDAPQDLILYVTCEAALLGSELTSAEVEAEFLRGGDARALCCEPDEHLLVGRTGPTVTQLPTPPGAVCC